MRQSELLEMLPSTKKHAVCVEILSLQCNERALIIERKLNQLYKYGFIERVELKKDRHIARYYYKKEKNE